MLSFFKKIFDRKKQSDGFLISKRLRIRKAYLIFAVSILVVSGLFSWVYLNSKSKKVIAAPLVCVGDNCTIINNNTSTRDSYIVYPNANFAGKNLTISGNVDVVMYGHHDFKNLTLNSGVIMTHEALAVGDFDHDTFVINTTSGANKIVDISVSETLTLNSGSQIDVSGKGYPGGDCNYYGTINCSLVSKGYGPGGGGGGGVNYKHGGGGGGGYGGAGGSGIDNLYPGDGSASAITANGGVAYGDSNLADQYGSGGGAIKNDAVATGGAGGGRIKIETNTLQINNGAYIKANGGDGILRQSGGAYDPDFESGAGSGGSIYLTFSDGQITSPEAQTGMNRRLSYYTVATPDNLGSHGSVTFTSTKDFLIPGNTDFKRIQANGGITGSGLGGRNYGGTGGGGRIVIGITGSDIKVTKSVTKIYDSTTKSSVDVAGAINLKMGDKIRVDLKVEKLITNFDFTLTDRIYSSESVQDKTSPSFGPPSQENIKALAGISGIYDPVTKTITWNVPKANVTATSYSTSYELEVK